MCDVIRNLSSLGLSIRMPRTLLIFTQYGARAKLNGIPYGSLYVRIRLPLAWVGKSILLTIACGVIAFGAGREPAGNFGPV